MGLFIDLAHLATDKRTGMAPLVAKSPSGMEISQGKSEKNWMLRGDDMLVGNKSVFAIESATNTYDSERGVLGVGYFLLYLDGFRYGVMSQDATALANSFDHVALRIENRGKHVAPFASDGDPKKIAQSFREALYSDEEPSTHYFGIPESEFSELFHKNNLIMAPDGDEAFDDSSYVLQFDVGNKVRVIGFQCKDSELPSSDTLRDIWMDADDFYATLEEWKCGFYADWQKNVNS